MLHYSITVIQKSRISSTAPVFGASIGITPINHQNLWYM